MKNTRTSPLHALAAAAPAPVRELLSHPGDLVKRGVKGPGVVAWARHHGLPLPAARYGVLPAGADGIVARTGDGELILECPPRHALWERWHDALAEPAAGVYEIPQQSVTVELHGKRAPWVLALSCAVNLADEPAATILYTRVAGVSCAVLPRGEGEGRTYRLWVDFSLAPYLWTTLAELAEHA
jgi:heterotetrameric sarcosine oxidase gamma subunit